MKPLPRDPCLGVIVCCRDEERTVQRRLRNLALSAWPDAGREHRVIVVDDGSRDATARLASEFDAAAWPRGVRVDVLGNRLRPGKAGAIATGVQELSGGVDLVILTDADVLGSPDALVRLAQRFARVPRLGMACAAQRFVDALPESGATLEITNSSGGSFYDGATAWVRALESRFGGLFSVHGQLLAWRADLGLLPRPAFAADDLDLMSQARAAGTRVELEAAARFFEAKPQADLRRIQALRRARAYLQFARALDPRRAPGLASRIQWLGYKLVPPLFPWLVLAGILLFLMLVPPLLHRWIEVSANHGFLLDLVPWLLALAACVSLWGICRVIVEAQHLERSQSLEDRWPTTR
ncbi:MAG: glycosyltransferase [Planctomycetes bacterium]|nr:glycosyltransferase [Planctomycetota bacterium]